MPDTPVDPPPPQQVVALPAPPSLGHVLRLRIAMAIAIVGLAFVAWRLPAIRRDVIRAVVKFDARPSPPPALPAGEGAGLPAVARTRVVMIDGLGAQTAATLPVWSAACKAGIAMTVDVGFPTVSLPVEAALWSGLTQQQSGIVFRSDRPLDPPLDRRAIPAQVAGSVAIAENYGWIVRSLGFARVEPAAEPGKPHKDANAEAWKAQWEQRALEAVQSDTRLAFVHILRVDTAGHKHGGASEQYAASAREADAILGRLMAADPGARWFLLSDHGHTATGGHGGEESFVRQVQGCIAGPGIAPATGKLVHVVDLSRAIADSTDTHLVPESRGRPLFVALAVPLEREQAIPPLGLSNGAGAIFAIVAGLALVTWSVRRWWLAPWWFVVGIVLLVAIRGVPSLSTPMIYKPEGRDMYLAWLPALALGGVTTWFGLRSTTLVRVLAAQLALPIAVAAALVTASGAWPVLLGQEIAPVVPRYTAWMSPALLMVAHGAAVVALAVLARLVRTRFDRSSPPERRPSAPADAA